MNFKFFGCLFEKESESLSFFFFLLSSHLFLSHLFLSEKEEELLVSMINSFKGILLTKEWKKHLQTSFEGLKNRKEKELIDREKHEK